MKTAFVTGATGYIGINLVIELVNRGWQVTCMHRQGSNPHEAGSDVPPAVLTISRACAVARTRASPRSGQQLVGEHADEKGHADVAIDVEEGLVDPREITRLDDGVLVGEQRGDQRAANQVI